MVQGVPDWAVFDIQGRRVEFASASGRDGIEDDVQMYVQSGWNQGLHRTAQVTSKSRGNRRPRYLAEAAK